MNSLEGSRVLVTGGAGLVGSHIVDQLIEEKPSEIVVFDDFSRGTKENLEDALKHSNVKIVEGNIKDVATVDKAISGMDYVFHQAAIRITRCAQEPRECMDVLVNGTFNVLEACEKHKVKKIVAASSASVYGLADNFPTREIDNLYGNRTIYGAAKVANEQILRSFAEMYDTKYVALRYFNIYGPRMDIFGVYTEVLIRWLECIDKGESPKIFGDGQQTMDFVFIKDIARSNLLAMKSEITDEYYNVASGTETSLLGLLEALLALTGSDLKPEFCEERKVNNVSRRLACTKKAKEELGFEVEYSLEQGLQELIDWRKALLAKKS